MTSKEYILKLRNIESVEIHEPLIEKAVDDFFRSNHLTLPEDHINFLKLCDGIFSFGRYFRLFGISYQNKFNLISWNSRDLWKFAWQDKLDDFLCFGETAYSGDIYHLFRRFGYHSIRNCLPFFPEQKSIPELFFEWSFFSLFKSLHPLLEVFKKGEE